MLGKSAKWLCINMIWGLCAPASANTTADDRALYGFAPKPAAVLAQAAAGDTADQLPAGKIKIALLLPLESATFSAAAESVRAGFVAAHEWEPDGIEISILDVPAGPRPAVATYDAAAEHHDIIVGPLARADVAAVAQSGKVSKPTLALATPEASAEVEIRLPPKMLAIGLSVEEEARQLARWAKASRKSGKALVIASQIAWQRRAAQAFATQWQQLDQEAQHIEIATSSGYLSAHGLLQAKKRLQDEKPALIFVALDAWQTRQLQQSLGRGPALYGTSQLNPLPAADWRTAEPWLEMNAVRLVDIPWLLQPDHPAVMVYPRPVRAPDQQTNPDLERLYALGIDAYRLAREIAAQRSEFELDGVTGNLSVRLGQADARFQRRWQPAQYQDGIVVPFAD